MTRWDWGYAYWALWIFGMFLIPELLGFFHVAPWPTLSETSWHAEAHWPILRTVLLGFLLGLAVHIVYRVPLWEALAGGLVVAVVAHHLHERTPTYVSS